MRKIIYYVATSIDGYISGPDDDISGFVQESDAVEKYLQDLQHFDTVIMGRKTYEFGYRYGLEPGQPAYPHMEHYIFSKSLNFESRSRKLHVCSPDIELIRELKQQKGTDLYLCGGGQFAGWLLEHEMVDILKIKLNPFISGSGVPLFGDSRKMYYLRFIRGNQYQFGVQILEYQIEYGKEPMK
jgi:dihydrofolate reductase